MGIRISEFEGNLGIIQSGPFSNEESEAQRELYDLDKVTQEMNGQR